MRDEFVCVGVCMYVCVCVCVCVCVFVHTCFGVCVCSCTTLFFLSCLCCVIVSCCSHPHSLFSCTYWITSCTDDIVSGLSTRCIITQHSTTPVSILIDAGQGGQDCRHRHSGCKSVVEFSYDAICLFLNIIITPWGVEETGCKIYNGAPRLRDI